MKNICPVCGYDKLEDKPYDEYGYPTYVTCSCCGYEFGFDDSSKGKTFVEYREEWISKGFKFFNKEKQPDIWDEETLKIQIQDTSKVDYSPRIRKKKDNF